MGGIIVAMGAIVVGGALIAWTFYCVACVLGLLWEIAYWSVAGPLWLIGKSVDHWYPPEADPDLCACGARRGYDWETACAGCGTAWPLVTPIAPGRARDSRGRFISA